MRAKLTVITVGAILSAGVLVAAPSAIADQEHLGVGGTGSDSARSSRPATTVSLARAATAVVVGATGTPGGCGPGTTTWTQQASGAGSPSYVVPGAGVITSYSNNANATAGSMRFVILGPAAAPNDRTVLAFTPLQPLTVSTLNTFAVRIPVPAGASLGMFIDTNLMGCISLGIAGDTLSSAFLDPSTSTVFTPSGGGFASKRLNLSAVWEPDADLDGYGDVSQDACPESALTQAACPAPETTITKKPARHTSNRRVKIKFTASVVGSSFLCSRDGKPFKSCTSPYKRRFSLGKHKVLVQAVSPVGIVDGTPAMVKFKVTS